MKVIVGDKKENLQQLRTSTVTWTTGMCGRQRIKMMHDTCSTGFFKRGVEVYSIFCADEEPLEPVTWYLYHPL